MIRATPRGLLLTVLAAAIGVQLGPVAHDNPPASTTVPAPPPVAAVLRRACDNCHSHRTTWPWYSYVAPASWLVAHDVHDGRRHLNFSAWDTYAASEQQKHLLEISDEVKEGEMPPWFYTRVHPSSALSQSEVDAVVGWAESSSARLAGR
jgi:hypothetical protein